jgi:hypothetical protein
MEVHHHPHVEKKNFKVYMLEGLMIFVAVSMGFIAESIRESMVEHEIVKRNMELIVENLKEDTAQIEESIKLNTLKLAVTDSILFFRNENFNDTNKVKKFFPLFANVMTTDWFKSNNSGFEQMKSSGTIRLIKQKNVLDSLYKYESQNNIINYNGTIDDDLIHNKIEEIAGSFLVYNDVKNGKTYSAAISPAILNRFFNYYFYLNKNLSLFYIPELYEQKQKAIHLIQFLQNEYHLKYE